MSDMFEARCQKGLVEEKAKQEGKSLEEVYEEMNNKIDNIVKEESVFYTFFKWISILVISVVSVILILNQF